MHNSLVTVDSREAAMKESGDIILSGVSSDSSHCFRHRTPHTIVLQVEIIAEIGEVISGVKLLPQLSDCGKKFLLFKSLGSSYLNHVMVVGHTLSLCPGMAIEDVLSGALIYNRFIAKRQKLEH